jgi:ligand-binding sensor domain-containing protein
LQFYSRGDHIELSNLVYSVAVDNNGNKWFGGQPGRLTKFDGTTFTLYDSSNSPIKPSALVMAICQDKIGNLWIGGNGVGLLKFDGINWTHFTTTNSGLPHDYVKSIAIDSNNVKWIGTYGGGVAEYNDTNWIVHNPTWRWVEEVTVDNNGTIWAALYGAGLGKFNGTNWTLYSSGNSPLPNNYLLAVYPDAEGNIWAGLSRYAGLVRFNGSDWYFFDSTNSNISSYSITALCLDNNGKIIAGSQDGIYKSAGNDFELIQISDTPWLMRYINSLQYNNLTGELWIGGDYALFKFNGNSWSKWDTSNSPIPNLSIKNLLLDRQNKLWIATAGGITVLNGAEWTNYNTSNSGLPSNNVRHITEDSDGKKWISTAAGIAVFDGNVWDVFNTSNTPLPGNNINQTAIHGDIKWFALFGGLVKYDGTNWTVYDSSNSALMSDDVYRVAVQSDDKVWAGTRYNGLTCFTEDGSFTYTKQNSELLGNEIKSLTVDGDTLWIGVNGLNILHEDNWQQITTYNSPLNGGLINDIIVDDSGNKWIGNWTGHWGADLAFYSNNIFTGLDQLNSPVPIENSILYQNYPNPFNPSTIIKFSVPSNSPCKVILSIYDILGNKIAELVNEEKPAGEYNVEWDASNFSSGVYFYRLQVIPIGRQAGEFISTKKLLLMK